MVVTTKMYHAMRQTEPTISDIERIDLELQGKKAIAQ